MTIASLRAVVSFPSSSAAFSFFACLQFCRERLGEIEQRLPEACKFILNVHGDEPFLDPSHIATVINVLLSVPANDTRIIGASLRTRLKNQEEATNRAKVKMIINPSDETVLYLSRALIPHSKSGEFNPEAVYWSHINVMCAYIYHPPHVLALDECLCAGPTGGGMLRYTLKRPRSQRRARKMWSTIRYWSPVSHSRPQRWASVRET
jgi:hypothetical protein